MILDPVELIIKISHQAYPGKEKLWLLWITLGWGEAGERRAGGGLGASPALQSPSFITNDILNKAFIDLKLYQEQREKKKQKPKNETVNRIQTLHITLTLLKNNKE